MALEPPTDEYTVHMGTLTFPEGKARVDRAVRFQDADGVLKWRIVVSRISMPIELVEKLSATLGDNWSAIFVLMPDGDARFKPDEWLPDPEPHPWTPPEDWG